MKISATHSFLQGTEQQKLLCIYMCEKLLCVSLWIYMDLYVSVGTYMCPMYLYLSICNMCMYMYTYVYVNYI